MKRFDRKIVLSFFIFGTLFGLIYFQIYFSLLKWQPSVPISYEEVSDTIYFDVNSVEIKQADWLKILNIVKHSAGKVLIIGSADSSGNTIKNWQLAQNRALAVKEILTTIRLIPPDSNRICLGLIKTMNFGDYQPLVPNSTIQNRQINRNTVIKWMYKKN